MTNHVYIYLMNHPYRHRPGKTTDRRVISAKPSGVDPTGDRSYPPCLQ